MTNPRIQKPVQRSAQQSSVPAEALHGDGREEEAAVRPFPIDCLPPAFAAMAMEVARVVMVDESLPGAAILAVLAASCGRGIQCHSGPSRVTRANLYVLIAMLSGFGKSRVFDPITKPFERVEDERIMTFHDEEEPELKARMRLLESQARKLERDEAAKSPEMTPEQRQERMREVFSEMHRCQRLLETPSLTVEDITSEKFAVKLARNQETLASFSADAGKVLQVILGKYSKSGTPDDTIYLKAYTGDPVKVDRMNGTSLRLESPCLSVLWLTQPAKLTMLLTEGALAESGFLPRFLLMQIPKEEKPRHMDPAAPPDNLQEDVQIRYDRAIQTLLSNPK